MVSAFKKKMACTKLAKQQEPVKDVLWFGPGMSPREPCVEGLVPSYWETLESLRVEPSRKNACHQECASEGDCGTSVPSAPSFPFWTVRWMGFSATCFYHDVLLCTGPNRGEPSNPGLKPLKLLGKVNLSSVCLPLRLSVSLWWAAGKGTHSLMQRGKTLWLSYILNPWLQFGHVISSKSSC